MIVAPDTQGALAAKKATTTIPIVMSSGDPIGAGIVASLAKPGGNITGVSAAFDDFASKWVELLRDVRPIRNIAVVWNPASASAGGRLDVIERAAANHGLQVLRPEIRSAADVDAPASGLARTSVGGLIFDADLTLIPYLARSSNPEAWCSLGLRILTASCGRGAMAYGPSLTDVYRLIGVYVDRILRGAKPSRAACRAGDEVRAGHQPQDRQGPRPDDPAVAPAAGGPGDRVMDRRVFVRTLLAASSPRRSPPGRRPATSPSSRCPSS